MSVTPGAARPHTSGPALAGILIPGLGHVLTGRLRAGVPLLGYTALLAAAAVMAVPRLGRLLLPTPAQGGFSPHAWIALAAWVACAGVVWTLAVRHAFAGSGPAARRGKGFLAVIWKELWHNRMGLLGFHFVLLLTLATLMTPLLAPHDPDRIDVGPHLQAPSLRFPCGTDDYGRDLLSRLLFGARISLSIGFLAVGISATFGAAWGAISGYAGRRVDVGMSWLVDLLLSLPRLVLVVTIVGLFRPTGARGIYLVILILGLTGWMGVSRIVRGMVLSLKEQEFIQATRALGQSARLIVFRHLLPNALAPVIVHATLGVGATILAEATLSFLGLGVPPPISTWGSIVNDGREYLRSAWWIATIPGFLIVFAVMSFNLLGDGLRDALDPKLRHRG